MNVTLVTSVDEQKQAELLDVEPLTAIFVTSAEHSKTEGVTTMCLTDHVIVSIVIDGGWNDSDEEDEAV